MRTYKPHPDPKRRRPRRGALGETVIINAAIPKDLRKAVDARVDKEKSSLSAAVREALEAWVETGG